MRALTSLAWALSLAAALSQLAGCSPAAAPSAGGDELVELAELVESAQAASPLAHLVCQALPQGGDLCEGVVDAVDDSLAIAAPLVASVQACREQLDQACVDDGRATARRLLPELRRLLPLVRLLGGSSAR